MGARLLYRDSRGQDGQVALSPEVPCYVGRALDCAIRTDDAMVSRKHSMIRMENGTYYVEDLGSSNGTHVNNQRVGKHRLNHNDVVRCGSLLLRYVEDGPLLPHGAYPQGGGAGAAQNYPAYPNNPGPGSYDANQGQPPGYGAHPGYSGQGGGYGNYGQPLSQPPGAYGQPGTYNQQPGAYNQPPAGFGQPPGFEGTTPGAGESKRGGTQRLDVAEQPHSAATPAPEYSGAAGAANPYGQPPPMPADTGSGNQFGAPDLAEKTNPNFGAGGPPSIVGSGGVIAGAADSATPQAGSPFDKPGDEDSVVVDLDAMGETAEKLAEELAETRRLLDELQSNYDREVADGKRLRAETATLRERIEQLNESIDDGQEQASAHAQVADQLRDELAQVEGELNQAREEAGTLGEEIQARERQLRRSQDDIAKLKEEQEELNRQLAEVSKTKDDGWKKLNEQLSEIEQLREVINEQERMLEERRVGLISQEEVIKELRSDREKQLKISAQLKAERDELQAKDRRVIAQMQAIDEENKRLSRLLAEAQSGTGSGGAPTVDLTNDLREARIEVKKLEVDRDRYQEMYERADGELQRLENRVAQLEVEVREANERGAAATSSRSVIEESLAKAEVARHKAVEEALTATKERDEATATADKTRREAERLRRRIQELESAEPADAEAHAELADKNHALRQQLERLQKQASEFERRTRELQAELETARAQAHAAQPEPGNTENQVTVAADELQTMAMDVYEGVNDILSEIRNNLKILQRDFAGLSGERSDDSIRIMGDTIQGLIDSAEDAKGVARRLRELAEFG